MESSIVKVDLEALANQSELYRAMVDFKGKDALDELIYPVGSRFSQQCFESVVQCLGSREEFAANLKNFPIEELFHVALYLGSDTLLYYVVIDLLTVETAVTILSLTLDTVGEHHNITITIIQFIEMVIGKSFGKVLLMVKTDKAQLRNILRNSKRRYKKFVSKAKIPQTCLCCKLHIEGQAERDINKRITPMSCCGMAMHLKCQLKLLSRRCPVCPACGTFYFEGKIDDECRDLHSVMNVRYLENYRIPPLPYRVRHDVFY